MSSYHELIARQTRQDRLRTAQPEMPHGANHEISAETVAEYVNDLKKADRENKLSKCLRFAAKCQNAFASLFGHQAIAPR